MRVPNWIRKTAAIAAAVFLCVAVIAFVVLPPAPRETSGGGAPGAWLGAFHVHSAASDGGGSRDEIARAAAAAGLRFVILTDHGDGTIEPAAPEYLHGVLVLTGVEITTSRGHYAAFGLARAPYPLGGAPAAVIEDVERLGGFGVAAHPDSPKTDLRWRDWNAFAGGLELLNGDSAWRDEGVAGLLRAVGGYPLRPAQAIAGLIARPDAMLARLDALSRTRRIVGLAGADAHGRLPLTYDEGQSGRGWTIAVPSYAQAFRATANLVDTASAPSGDAVKDGASLLDAVRAGRVTAAVPALASPIALAFTARTAAGQAARMGDRLPAGPMTFDARAADVQGDGQSGVRIRLMRDGRVAAEADGPAISHRAERAEDAAGVWRVEVTLAHRPQVPWLLGNPIVVAAIEGAGGGVAGPQPRNGFETTLELAGGAWAVEKHTASEAGVSLGADGARFDYALAGGTPSGQYGAAVRATDSADAWTHVLLRARAGEPTRLWVQLRLSDSETGQRWGRSIYLDRHSREFRLSLADFAPLEPGPSALRPVETPIRSVLLVVDTVNSAPGRSGQIVIERLALERQ
ncbi:MAG: hypothetical protein M3Q55_02975 [Acidobacteriota bacterium]|nr:hypothetical protein [Acidobacteriota bacterium]